MIKIELNIDGEDKVFNIAEGWDEVTVKQSSQLFSLQREGKNQIELAVSIVSILSEMSEDIIYMMNQEEFIKLVQVINFTNEEVKGELKEFITIDGVDYYLKKDFEQLNLGEIISIETLMEQSGNDLTKTMSKLLCIFLRKKLENGNLESFRNEFMDREEIFNKAIITDVNDIFLFFLDGNNSSDNNIKVSSENQK